MTINYNRSYNRQFKEIRLRCPVGGGRAGSKGGLSTAVAVWGGRTGSQGGRARPRRVGSRSTAVPVGGGRADSRGSREGNLSAWARRTREEFVNHEPAKWVDDT